MRTNLQITPSFGARVLIASDVPKAMPLSEKTIGELIDRGEALANNNSYIKVMITPTETMDVYKLSNESLIMKNKAIKIINQDVFAKKENIVPKITEMLKTLDVAFKNMFSYKKNL